MGRILQFLRSIMSVGEEGVSTPCGGNKDTATDNADTVATDKDDGNVMKSIESFSDM